MDDRRQKIEHNRVIFALDNLADTGNALDDALDVMLEEEDSFEFQLALMGKPITTGTEEGAIVCKNMDYYLTRWRELYVKFAIEEIEAAEKLHGDKSQ